MNVAGAIVGLGNPGRKYARTRHNIGFMVLEAFRRTVRNPEDLRTLESAKGRYALWQYTFPEQPRPWLLCEPLTYMNESGRAVAALSRRFRIAPDNLLVVHDELDLAFGRMRFKNGGGLAGHKGLRSIAGHLGTKGFPRLRMGIGRPSAEEDVVEYVLSPFTGRDRDVLQAILDEAAAGIDLYCREGIQAAMNRVHVFAA
jgi:PTH1 family peptidyl-tRNA hydrolase